jgi:integrase
MRMLSDSNIVKQADETIWLQLKRHKTGTPENVRLTDIPITLIDKYKGIDKDGHLFPMPSYTTIRLHLKTIADKCKLGHYFSYHQARHTFGTTICLGNGIPIETVSKIMGHCSINITQHYAKVTERKIADDVRSLGSCIDKNFSLAGIELPPSRILRDYSQRHQKPRLGKKKKSVIEL